MSHGTRGSYNRGCHCAECRAANAAYKRAWRASRPDIAHGQERYAQGCRCAECTNANRLAARRFRATHPGMQSEYSRRWRAKKKARCE